MEETRNATYADAVRVNQSLIHQSQLLFGYGKQRRESPICQAAPHDVRLRSIFRKQVTLVICHNESKSHVYTTHF